MNSTSPPFVYHSDEYLSRAISNRVCPIARNSDLLFVTCPPFVYVIISYYAARVRIRRRRPPTFDFHIAHVIITYDIIFELNNMSTRRGQRNKSSPRFLRFEFSAQFTKDNESSIFDCASKLEFFFAKQLCKFALLRSSWCILAYNLT